MMRIPSILAMTAGSALWLHGQARVDGPVAGFVFDREVSRLRPIVGIPGASLMGDPLDTGYEIRRAYVAPRQDAALLDSADGQLHVLSLRSGGDRALETTGELQRVVFSPTGTAAAVVTRNGLRILSGLPDTPEWGASFDLKSYGDTGSIAVSDDGAYLLFVAGGAVRLLSSAGHNRALLEASDNALAAFTPGRRDAAVVDDRLIVLRDVAANAETQVVAESAGPSAGLAFSNDGRKLMVAGIASGVAVFDLETGARSDFDCDCTPSGLTRMGAAFRLNEPGDGPIWLLDSSADAPRMLFVPARRSE